MEALQKDTFLSNLYSIRAGLSILSQEKERVEKITREENALISERDEKIRTAAVTLGRECNEYIELDKRLSKAEKIIKDSKEEMKVSTFARVMAIIGLILSIVGLFAAGVLLGAWLVVSIMQDINPLAIPLGITDNEWGVEGGLGWVGFFLVIIIPCGAIAAVVFGFKQFRHFPTVFSKLLSRMGAPKRIAKNEDEVRQLRKRKAEIEKRYNEKEHQILQAYAERLALKRTQKREILQRAMLFYQILEETFSAFLDVRDWKHVDLITFYFETGRAESMKEALQQVDHQVQADMIVQAIGKAVEELREIILYSTNRLAQIMDSGFRRISSRISSLEGKIGAMQSQIGAQNTQIAQLASAQSMTAALQNRSNRNSLQLMEDVRYMRTVAENAEIRARNNL